MSNELDHGHDSTGNDNWQGKLTPEQFHVLREKGTERPFSGEYVNFFEDGTYTCAGCGSELFRSENKYDSGCGWPAFDDVANSDAVEFHEDTSFEMYRTEVICKKCGGHLGHIFPGYGPKELPNGKHGTGNWICINSVALNFKKNE